MRKVVWRAVAVSLVALLGLLMFGREQSAPVYKTWKTITLGTGLRSVSDFRGALEDANCHVNGSALHVLESTEFTVSTKEVSVDLVAVSLDDLGLKRTATRKEIYARAQELGLQVCPAEVGLQLRLQYLDQAEGEWIHIAMDPIKCRDGEKKFLEISHSVGGLWLYGDYGDEANTWTSGDLWVFILPK